MAAPAELITHGSLASPILNDVRLRSSLSDLDSGELEYTAASRGAFTKGTAPDGYPGLRIHEIDERNFFGRWKVVLQVKGLESGTSKQTKLEWSEDPTGWDVANEEKIVRDTATFTYGSRALSAYPNMRLMHANTSDFLDGHWVRRSFEHRGIKRLGLSSRRITVNEKIVQPGVPVEVTLPGGWPGQSKTANVSFPRIVVTETLKTLQSPPTHLIPGAVTNGPISGVPFPRIQEIVISGSDIVSNYPHGWKYASIDAEELYTGAGIWLISVTYEKVPPTEF